MLDKAKHDLKADLQFIKFEWSNESQYNDRAQAGWKIAIERALAAEEEVRQLREGNKHLAETLLIKDELQKLLIDERDKLKLALKYTVENKIAGISREQQTASILSEIKGTQEANP